MSDTLVKLIGWKATILHGDPGVYDRWKWLARHLSPGNLRTLDAGCGSGAFTLYAAKIGNESVGLSFDERKNQVASERANILRLTKVQFYTLDLRKLDEWIDQLGRFDQIICFETIEHILDDQKPVRDLAQLLRPGGKILLTTPFKEYHHMVGDTISSSEDGGHVRRGYDHGEIKELFCRCGLQVLKEEFITGFVSQQLINLMRLLARVNYLVAWSVVFPLRILQIFDSPLTKLLRYPYLCVGVVGIKPIQENCY